MMRRDKLLAQSEEPACPERGLFCAGVGRMLAWGMPLGILLGLILVGCGGKNQKVVVHGTVRVGGQQPDAGQVRFVPIEGTPGTAAAALIIDGQYRIDAQGGLSPGKYRVEIDARKKTGRMVQQYNGFEMALVPETTPMAPPQYASPESPVVKEVSASSDGRIDLELPSK